MANANLNIFSDLNTGDGSLVKRISQHLRDAVEDGSLAPGDRIPATRRLAVELGVSRGSVTAAVEQLVAEGILESRIGSGTYVSAEADFGCWTSNEDRVAVELPVIDVPPPDIDPEPDGAIDFRPCRPSVREFPLHHWRRAMSLATSAPPTPDYSDPRGELRLRQTLSDYLRRARGLKVSAQDIIVTNGSVHAMHLAASVTLHPNDSVVFEDPGYPLARQCFAQCGARMHYCDIDEAGMRLDRLPDRKQRTKLVYVTPSHQFPKGVRLSLARRRALVSWANDAGAIIIEDDYDGEYRYDVAPLAPLAALSPHNVLYCGTFSKTMFPGIRIGFATGPRELIEAMAFRRAAIEYCPPIPTQLALHQFIESGAFERHVHKMRRVYGAKRRRLADKLTNRSLGVSPVGLESGLSCLLQLPEGKTAEAVSRTLWEARVTIPPLNRYAIAADSLPNALVCGYAAANERETETLVEQIARSI